MDFLMAREALRLWYNNWSTVGRRDERTFAKPPRAQPSYRAEIPCQETREENHAYNPKRHRNSRRIHARVWCCNCRCAERERFRSPRRRERNDLRIHCGGKRANGALLLVVDRRVRSEMGCH